MSTEAQIEANRANAQKSTGPVTAEGKAASSQNRLEHGFCGAFRVLDYEKAEEYDFLLNALREEHDPATATEYLLVERIAQHHWLAQRAQFLQSEMFEVGAPSNADKLLALYLRYQTQNERAFSKCLSDLLKLRAEKRKMEIGFEREKQRAAQENRKTEVHERRMKRSDAPSKSSEIDSDLENLIKATLSNAPLPALKQVLSRSLKQFAGELKADPQLASTLKAA